MDEKVTYLMAAIAVVLSISNSSFPFIRSVNVGLAQGVNASSPTFSISIVASVNNYSSTCVFGVNPGSSINYSAKYDSLAAYPHTGVYCYLLYYNQSTLENDKLSQYTVPSNGATTWLLEVESIDQEGTLTLSWNDTTVSSLTLADHITKQVYANMSEVGNFSFRDVAGGVSDFEIVYLSPTLDAVEILAASPHSIITESPNNNTVYNASLTLNVSVNFLESDSARTGIIFWQSLTSVNYSIDDKSPVNIFTKDQGFSGAPVNLSNVTISDLTDGQHKIVLTAVFIANVGDVFMPTYTFISEPTYFTVETENAQNTKPPSNPEPFPWLPVVAIAVVVVTVVAVAALVFFKKRKH
jgi:hypothetical protein